MKRKLEEALQDCLEALATGQATSEECLARYPDLAPELEPLLRMGRRLQQVYDVEPSPLYAEAARQRFLAAVASRRQRALAQALVAHPRRALWRWAPAALGSAAVVAFAAWASILALGGGSGLSSPGPGELAFSVPPPIAEEPETPAPQSVVRVVAQPAEEHLAAIREAVEQGTQVEPAAIGELRKVNENLAATLDDPMVSDEDLSYIEELLNEQDDLISSLGDLVPPEASGDLEETIKAAGAVRNKIVERRAPMPTVIPASPTPEETPTATPEATETPVSTPTPEATPSETPEPSPTAEAEGESTQEPTPTPTAAP